MAELKARFSLIDEMSEKLSSMAECGQNMIGQWENANNSINSAMENAASGASNVISSLNEVNNAASNAVSGANELSGSMGDLKGVVNDVAAETDNWTKSAQNYDKSALEAVYSTEQLVEMGYKTADALYTESDIFYKCEEAAGKLNVEMENAVSVHDELANSFEQVTNSVSAYADGGKISSEMQEQLENTSKAAAQALQDLETAQNEAKAAMENYDSVIISGTTDTQVLEAAQNQAAEAAANLSAAEDNAKKAVEDFSKASDDAGKSFEENGEKSANAIEALASTVIASKIADEVRDIAKSAYELADAFSNAEEVVVNATGASGEALKGLEQSMMSAYSSHNQDLNTTAGAIGEINTRMGLTGEALTDVTGKFLDYSRITGTNVVGSVQNVTKVMNQWGVDMDNVESVLDRLAYAGQISGASVDSLSATLTTGAASFKEAGLSLDNTIQLLADFELAGINSTTALTAMRTAVNNFTKDGLDAKTALQSTITEIANMKNTSEATAKAVEVFGSRAGQQLAAAIKNGTVSIESFTTTLDTADGTLRKTAETGETLGEKWDKSSNKIKSAFTSALQPTIDKISSGMASVVGWIGEVLNKHPMLTSAVTAVGAGLGVVAIGIAGVAVASLKAIPAVAAFGTALNGALGPIGWIAAGATVLVGGITMISNAFSKAEDKVADYNGTMEECANEIRRTEAAYQKAIEIYGENNAAVKDLEENLTTLHAQYEKGGGDMQVYVDQADKLCESLHEISVAQSQAMEEIDKTETSSLTAVAMLAALSEQSNITNADLDVMSRYAEFLNNEFDCDIKVNYNTKELTGFNPKILTDAIVEAANSERVQTALDYLSGADFQDKYINAKKGVISLTEEVDNLERELSDANLPEYEGTRTPGQISADLQKAYDALNKNNAALREAENDMYTYGLVVDSTGKFTETFKTTLDEVAMSGNDVTETTEKQTRALSEYEQGLIAAKTTYQQYQEEIEKICEAYDEAYQSALESFQGQFGLFDTASNAAEDYEHTINNVQTALDSQLQYWQTYQSNIEAMRTFTADEIGVSKQYYDDFMEYVRSGTPEAASLLNDMVDKLQDGNVEAVKKMIETKGQISDIQKDTASEVADWETDFSKKMDDVTKKMQETIDGMNLSDEASFAASNTMGAYARIIETAGGHAVAAAQHIANQVSNALASASGSINIDLNSSTPRHAAGTTNAEDVFIAGENGPELIVGKAGSTVFPAMETNRIISAVSDMGGTNYTNNNSYSTAQSSAEYSTVNNTENTEVVNNYNTVQSSYDDTKIIYLLETMENTFRSMENEIGGASTPNSEPEYNASDTYIQETPEIIVDLSVLDNLISKQRYGDEINSYTESVTYGDTQNIDSSRSYNTEYGDTVSNFNNSITAYNNAVRNITESVNSIDESRRYENTVGDSINNNSESSVNYGDNVRNYESAEYSNISKSLAENYIADYSRRLENSNAYNNAVRNITESVNSIDESRRYENTVSDSINNNSENSVNYGDNIKQIDSTIDYGNSIKNAAETAYIAPVDNEYKIISHSDSELKNSVWAPNNSVYKSGAVYSIDNDSNYSPSVISGDTIKNINDNSAVYQNTAGDTVTNAVNSNYADSAVSIVLPFPIDKFKEAESYISESRSIIEKYYSSAEHDTAVPEIYREESVINGIYENENSDRVIAADDSRVSYSENSEYSESVSKKEININFGGEGSVTVHGGMSKEEILEIMWDYVKPVLSNIISNEILEEGESSYEY